MCCVRIALVWLVAGTGVVPVARAQPPKVTFEVAFRHLRFKRPLYVTSVPDGSDRLFVVEQAGRVYWFENDPRVDHANVALDITGRVRRHGNEEGLLGLAFHPGVKQNSLVFLHYTAVRGPRRNVLARFVMDAQRRTIDPASQQIILEVQQPWSNHNGGMIDFGPDGYLYVALGDGGAAGDPMGNGQNRATLLGTILRIDVDRADPGLAYAIPRDNPFVGQANVRGEIWAYGLRNPWRFSFDRLTGDLWAGDVGQDRWEEIDLIRKGGNYGWNLWEANHAFEQRERTGPFEKPVIAHGRQEARSITGGYVYRGTRLPGLVGAYVYGDFVTGLIWSLRYDGQVVTEHCHLGRVPEIASFGQDRHGELYITSFDGRIYKLVAGSG